MGFENGHLLRCTIRATNASGDELVNTLHYDLQSNGALPGEDNDPQTLANRLRDDVRSQWVANVAASWTFDPVLVVDEIDPQNPTAPRSSWTAGPSTPGTKVVSGDVLPQFCSALARVTTARLGRRFNGRLWIMGTFLESEQNAGAWSPSYLTGLQAMADSIPLQPDIALGPGPATANWCVYSRTQRAANLDPYAEHVTDVTVRSLVHSLRRRAQY